MARIAHELPDWRFDIYPREDEARAKTFDIRAIPTFIVFQEGRELGRIIENAAFGSLEADLWEIVSKALKKSHPVKRIMRTTLGCNTVLPAWKLQLTEVLTVDRGQPASALRHGRKSRCDLG